MKEKRKNKMKGKIVSLLDEKDKKIEELKDEIEELKLRLNTIYGKGGIHLIETYTPSYIGYLIKAGKAGLRETGSEGKARRDERIAELEHENDILKEYIKILGGSR